MSEDNTTQTSAVGVAPVLDPKAELAAWYVLKARIAAECAPLVEQERAMRKRLFDHFFPSPAEGTNNHTLPDGFIVKGGYPIERKVDSPTVHMLRSMPVSGLEPAFRAQLNMADTPDDMLLLEALSLQVDKLLTWEPKLVVKEYRKLTAEQALVFDRCLQSKPGSISLEVAAPATRATPTQAVGFGPQGQENAP